jgi:hypothetical protein
MKIRKLLPIAAVLLCFICNLGKTKTIAMHSEATYKLLGHLYQIVPARESQSAIIKEVFSSGEKPSVDEMLKELMNEGYIYQWKDYPGDGAAPTGQDEFGMTPKGILFFDNYEENKRTPIPFIQEAPLPDKIISPVAMRKEPPEENEQTFSFRRAIPAIVLIVFAIALVWFITHIKKTT